MADAMPDSQEAPATNDVPCGTDEVATMRNPHPSRTGDASYPIMKLFNSSLEIAAVMSALDLGLFKRLAESEHPLSVEVLAPSGADPILVGRILRYLAANDMIEEVSKDHFIANQDTHRLSDPNAEGALNYIFHISGPTYRAMPTFLHETGYQNSTHGKLAWHKGENTDLDLFPWLEQHPVCHKWFQQMMSLHRESNWLEGVDFSEDISDDIVFVDVGGGFGQQCQILTKCFPSFEGRVILQDRPETIASAPPIKGVQAMEQDFFMPQVIQGARFYYLRGILHDWPDAKCVDILRNLVPAMGPNSKILINEIVLPNENVHWWSACMDLHMYIMLGAMERTESQWKVLLDTAGLRIVQIKKYNQIMQNSIIMAEPKPAA